MTWATKMMDAVRADDEAVAKIAINMPGFRIDEQLSAHLPLNNNYGGAFYYADAYVEGDTALHLCLRNSKSQVARLLLQNGAQLDIRNCRIVRMVICLDCSAFLENNLTHYHNHDLDDGHRVTLYVTCPCGASAVSETPKEVLAELVAQEEDERYLPSAKLTTTTATLHNYPLN